jgi:virulence-associated protein VapD
LAVTIGELLVNLRASTASFAKDLSKAEQLSFNTSREIERSFKRVGGVVTAELTAATTAITASIAKSIESADQMGKLAQKTGLTVEQFSGLAYAAKIADIPVDTLAKSFVILSKNLEKSNEQTLEGKAAHSALTTLFQGSIPVFKDTNDAFEQIAARLAVLPDGFQKTALATQIFGKAGASLIPLINENVDGIRKLVAEARSFGVVISDKTAHSAQEFQDTLKRILTAFEGLSLQLAEKLLPYLQSLANDFLVGAKDAQSFNQNIEVMANLVKIAATGVIAVAGSLKVLGAQAAQFITIIKNLGQASLGFGLNNAELAQSEKNVKDAFLGTVETIQNLWVPALTKANEAAVEHKTHQQSLIPVNENLKKAYDDIVKKLQEEIIVFTQGTLAMELHRLKTLGATDAMLAHVRALSAQIKNLKEGRDALTGFAPLLTVQTKLIDKLDDSYEKLKEQGFQVWESARTPLERYSIEVQKLDVLLKAGLIDQETYNRKTEEWATNLHLVSVNAQELNKRIGTDLKQGITEAFDAAIFRSGSLIDVFKNLIIKIGEAIIQATILNSVFKFLGIGPDGTIGGGFLGSIFGGFLAGGGTAEAGKSYVVGENGPERFYPAVTGTVVPNGGGNATNITYNIDARGADASVEMRIRRAIAESENRSVGRAVIAVRDLSLRTT